jgi:putative Ca2+/H+ antiporter (TMEM165/GDT1 family)
MLFRVLGGRVGSLAFADFGAIAEIGDKSQFMLLILSIRFRNDTVAIIVGMIAAMIIAHVPAGFAGAWFAASIDPAGLSWAVGLLFFGMAALALLVDLSEQRVIVRIDRVVLTVLATILLAEIGGKSPIAAALSSAQEGSPLPLIGSIIGAIAINLPVAIAGPLLAQKLVSKGIDFRWAARFTAVLFALLGVFAVFGLLR